MGGDPAVPSVTRFPVPVLQDALAKSELLGMRPERRGGSWAGGGFGDCDAGVREQRLLGSQGEQIAHTTSNEKTICAKAEGGQSRKSKESVDKLSTDRCVDEFDLRGPLPQLLVSTHPLYCSILTSTLQYSVSASDPQGWSTSTLLARSAAEQPANKVCPCPADSLQMELRNFHVLHLFQTDHTIKEELVLPMTLVLGNTSSGMWERHRT